MKTPVIVGIVSLYNPSEDNIYNMIKCAAQCEYFIFMDDSEISYESVINEIVINNKKEKIYYQWNEHNIGLAKSINKGIIKALDLSPDWILLIDQDSCIENNMIDIYKEYICSNDVSNIALIAPQYNYDRHKRSAKDSSKKITFANLSGSLLNVDILSFVGLYDERFFIDGLDNEWCLRARRKDYVLVECSSAILNHNPAETRELKLFNKTLFRYGWAGPDRYYYQFRSLLLIFRSYHDIYNLGILIYKRLKSVLLFKEKNLYRKACQ